MAARLNKRHQDMVREKIRASQLIKRLEKHVDGDVDLSATQVTAALGLLKKAVPDLKAIEHTEGPREKSPEEMTDAELDRRIAELIARKEEQASGETQSSSVHPVH